MKENSNNNFCQPIFNRIVWFLLVFSLFNPGLQAGESAPARLESAFIRFELFPENGEYRVLDKKTGVWWGSNYKKKRFGEATIAINGKREVIELTKCNVFKKGDALEALFEIGETGKSIMVQVVIIKPGNSIEVSYSSSEGCLVERISLLDKALWINNAEGGYYVVPVREGLVIPADSGKNFSHTFNTFAYEGCHMEMFGAVKRASAAMITWHDPYVSLVVDSEAANQVQTISSTLLFSKTAKKFRVHFIGKGDYVDIGKAYREVAKNKGWYVNWDEKLKGHPQRSLLFGAANIKLWSLLSRRMSEDSSQELSKKVNWTFEEAAEVAEHIKYDLGIEKALFTIGGWIRRGYDNQHPDILPSAPECGGDEKLAECAKRVRKLGYLFCLHDNYQDIYKDSPSWNEDYIMKTKDGKLALGGVWAGGRAYLTCSQKALELAKRPQNLPAVKRLTDASAYFIDTTYAAGLFECFDPKHPLTRWDDMKWKQALSDYARSLFEVFGSECGREWAIPHADFFEGLTGVSGRHYHDAGLENKVGGYVIPLFEIVYHDCIAMYGKYGYNPDNAGEYVLDHIIYGRPLNYHSIPSGLYWKKFEQSSEKTEVRIKPSGIEFSQVSSNSFQIAYEWEVEKPPEMDWKIFVHFTDKNGKILFQNDHTPQPPTSQWKSGKTKTGPFIVKIPSNVSTPFEVRVGMFRTEQAARASLIGKDDGELRYISGEIKLVNGKLAFETRRIEGEKSNVFVMANNGWADGLHPMDRFIKNTCEILNPLNEITARMQMSAHQFLTANKKVQRSVFGEGKNSVIAVVNAGVENFIVKSRYSSGEVVLPQYGFLIESPAFIAFNSLSWNGIKYETPTLFTIRSLDGREISRSKKLRIFHSFGDEKIKIGSNIYAVKRESIVSPQ